jgi:hypothetical protein
MRTLTARLGRRSPGRTLAVPAVSYRRLAARGGQPVALARLMGAAPDTIELILADHKRIRRLLRKDDDDAGYREDPGCPGAQPWDAADAAMAGVPPVALDLGLRALFAVPLQIDPRRRPAGPSGCAGSDGRRSARRPDGPHPCPDGSTARTRRSRIRAAVNVRSASRIPASSSPGTELISAQLGMAQPDALMRTRTYALGHRRAAADGPPLPWHGGSRSTRRPLRQGADPARNANGAR